MLNAAILLAAASRRPAAGGGSFLPSDLAGLVLWLDADDPASLTLDGSNRVSQWADKSGQGAHAQQSNTSHQPTYVASGIAGRGSLDFGGDYLELPDLTGIGGSQNRSAFIVAQRNDSNDDDHYISLGAESNSQAWRVRTLGGNLRIEIQGSGYTTAISPGTLAHQVACVLNGATLGDHTFWIDGNGAEVASGSHSVNTGVGEGSIGGLNRSATVPSKRMDGLLAEILVYNLALASDDRAKIEGHLAHKWGIENSLPASHPFKWNPP